MDQTALKRESGVVDGGGGGSWKLKLTEEA